LHQLHNNSKKGVDFILLASVFCLLFIGLMAVKGSSQPLWEMWMKRGIGIAFFFKRQLTYILLGILVLYLISKVNYLVFKTISLFAFILGLVLLVFVLFCAPMKGVHRWIRVGPVGFMPSALANVSLILYLSRYISMKSEVRNNNINLRDTIALTILMFGVPSYLMALQPNAPAVVIYGVIGVGILFISGFRLRSYFQILIFTALLIFGRYVVLGYETDRLRGWITQLTDFHKGSYQVFQSLIALGSGGLTGVGYGNSVQKFLYLPEIHTDFIAAYIGEEFGFLGILIILGLYLVFVFRGFLIAVRVEDTFGKLVASGITLSIGIPAIIHLGVVVGLLPVVGVALPLVSYQGSLIILQLFSVGILLNISSQTGCYLPFWYVIKSSATECLSKIIRKIDIVNDKLEKHPLYRVAALLAILITILVGIIQLVIWLKK
jgi:cell division protein FtsW